MSTRILCLILIFTYCQNKNNINEKYLKKEFSVKDTIETIYLGKLVDNKKYFLKFIYKDPLIGGKCFLIQVANNKNDTLSVESLNRISFERVNICDYNFDGLKDLDIITRPENRSGENTNHSIWLQFDKTIKKAKVPDVSNLKIDTCRHTLLSWYNGRKYCELKRLIWQGDSLTVTELLSAEEKEIYWLVSKYIIMGSVSKCNYNKTLKDYPEELLNKFYTVKCK